MLGMITEAKKGGDYVTLSVKLVGILSCRYRF